MVEDTEVFVFRGLYGVEHGKSYAGMKGAIMGMWMLLV